MLPNHHARRLRNSRPAYDIIGGIPLIGCVTASGSKNAALPILATALLAEGPLELGRVPRLVDVRTMSGVLKALGVAVQWIEPDRVLATVVDPARYTAPASLVARMRASFCTLGPLLARRGRAVVPLPGGCRIGQRPVDMHLRGLAALGAELSVREGFVYASAKRLRGAAIDLRGPRGSTVTGTANVLSAATLARGTTVISNAAREPEIVALGQCLRTMGADIEGLGTTRIVVRGVRDLDGPSFTLPPDRIETTTLLLAGAITGGDVAVQATDPSQLRAVLDLLDSAGAELVTDGDSVRVVVNRRLRAVSACATPYPGLPTDVQAQWTALMLLAAGRSTIVDQVFPERFGHVHHLQRFGARLSCRGPACKVDGVSMIQGARTTATDLRASAALVLAGLAAQGKSRVRRIDHLDRGYERFESKLSTLGAQIRRVELPARTPGATASLPDDLAVA